MREEWSLDDLVAGWTLLEPDQLLVGNKTGATRLGFALMLKFFEAEARFPSSRSEFSPVVVEFVARQVRVPEVELADYDFGGRSASAHRTQIRDTFGFRAWTRADEPRLAAWLVAEVCPTDARVEVLREALAVRCRELRIEPPGRSDRIVASAGAAFEKQFADSTFARLDAGVVERLEQLIQQSAETGLLAELKTDPGRVGLETLLREIDKLTAVRSLDIVLACSLTRHHGPLKRGDHEAHALTAPIC